MHTHQLIFECCVEEGKIRIILSALPREFEIGDINKTFLHLK